MEIGILEVTGVSMHTWDQVKYNLEEFLFTIQDLELHLTRTKTHLFSTSNDPLKIQKFKTQCIYVLVKIQVFVEN